MEVTPEAYLTRRPIAFLAFGAASGALGTLSAAPLTHEGSIAWSVACVTLSVAVLRLARLSWATTAAEVVSAVCVTLLWRIPMEGAYVSGMEVPGLSHVVQFLVAPGGRAWAGGDQVLVEAVDGTLGIRCDATKFAAWDVVSIGSATVLALYRHVGVRDGLRPALVASGLWCAIQVVRMSVLSAWLGASPGVLVPQVPSPLSVYWLPAVGCPLTLIAAVPVAALAEFAQMGRSER